MKHWRLTSVSLSGFLGGIAFLLILLWAFAFDAVCWLGVKTRRFLLIFSSDADRRARRDRNRP